MGQLIKRVDLHKGDSISMVVKSDTALKGGVIESKEIAVKNRMPAHKHLIEAFIMMIPHLMFGCKLAKPSTFSEEWFADHIFLQDERFEGITVTGVVVVGNDEMEGVKIIGRKTHANGDVVSLITPIIYLEAEGEHKYPMLTYLSDHLNTLFSESDQYYNKKKYGVAVQAEMFVEKDE